MNKQERIVVEVKKFLGVPFHHSGRSTLGIDCAGLLYLSYCRAGIELPKGDGRSYTVGWWKSSKEERLKNALINCGFIELSDNKLLDKGDIVLFKLYGKNYPAHHNGIMINSEFFIHAKCGWKSRDKFVAPDSLYPHYIKRLDCVLRYKDFI